MKDDEKQRIIGWFVLRSEIGMGEGRCRRMGFVKTVLAVTVGVFIALVIFTGTCILLSDDTQTPPASTTPLSRNAEPSQYSFSISTVDNEVYLTIKKTKVGQSDSLKVALNEKNGTFSWYDAQEVAIKDEETLTLKPRYNIGDFSKEYLVKAKNSNEDEIFNETVVLKPQSIKLGDSIVVNDIKIIPTSATYTEETAHSGWWGRTKAKEGYTFLVIEFKGKNIGNYESSAYMSGKKLLKTTKGCFYDPTTSPWFSSLQPEDEETDYLTFEIRKDQRGVEVYFEIGEEERILQL